MKFKCLITSIFLLTALATFSQHNYCQHQKRMIPRSGGGMSDDPGNLRSDTINVLGYDISLDMTLMNSGQISAHCEVHFAALMNNINAINLDLISLTVDSVTSEAGQHEFQHSGSQLYVELEPAMNTGEENTITVHYHGTPGQDASWGGFYFQSGYAYNIGVGFSSEPHTLGRAWFPCFDNFVERSKFTYHVLTNQNRTAYCNGIRTGVETVGQDSILTHWELQEEIPSYLASISASNYVQVEQSFQSLSGDEIPMWLVAKAIDTTDMKNSMVNLEEWMESVETRYGPYRWPRVGYCAVPFIGGAMEHATNISYPVFAIDGTLAWETLYAHEVAHHWWGDLVTCRNAWDMWINEGWASYSESLFKELIYGPNEYIDYVKDNHKDVLLHAHQNDDGRYPVSGVPSELTYGSHVYSKGADMAHTLRGYMGDEDFFAAIIAFMEEKQFSDVSSEDLRDFFQDYTEADLSSFFDNWIFEPGFPEFRVRSFNNVGGDTWHVEIEQHKHYSTDLYTNVHMQLVARDESGQISTSNVILSGSLSSFDLNLPSGFIPVVFYLNADDKISMAVLGEEQIINSTGSHDFDFAEWECDVNSLGSASEFFMRIENHWAAADEFQSMSGYFISPDRWWNVYHDGVEEGVDLTATIRYYGNDGQSNYFDPIFFDAIESNGLNEDSLILVYRPDGTSQWTVWTDYDVITTPGLTNWTGRIELNHVLPGQYAWAVHSDIIAVEETTSSLIRIYRSGNDIVVETDNHPGLVTITDGSGKLICEQQVGDRLIVPCTNWANGIYFVKWNDGQSSTINKVIR